MAICDKEGEGNIEATLVIKGIHPPKDRKEIMFLFHDHMATGHFGVWKTYNKIKDYSS